MARGTGLIPKNARVGRGERGDFLKTLDKWRDLLYTLCIMGIRAPIYIGFLREDKREKNSLKNRVG
jgi:transposase